MCVCVVCGLMLSELLWHHSFHPLLIGHIGPKTKGVFLLWDGLSQIAHDGTRAQHSNEDRPAEPAAPGRVAFSSSAFRPVSQFVCNGNNWNQQARYVLSGDRGKKISCQYERHALKPPHTAALIRPRTYFMNFTVLCAVQHLGNTFIRPNVNALRLLPATTHFVVGSCGTVSHNAKARRAHVSLCRVSAVLFIYRSVNPMQPLGNLKKND